MVHGFLSGNESCWFSQQNCKRMAAFSSAGRPLTAERRPARVDYWTGVEYFMALLQQKKLQFAPKLLHPFAGSDVNSLAS
uniref:Uncharacterized protein n=1 Tax=Oryza sativa subsp. japonica TaxID=39947 RepID=Q69NI7_ORYSJ|nr:hypothetical protein [Oryza sativa Japonica Group]